MTERIEVYINRKYVGSFIQTVKVKESAIYAGTPCGYQLLVHGISGRRTI